MEQGIVFSNIKISKGCHEIRGKTLGIIGYGHIGTQLSVLADSMGMNIIFHDILTLMPLGTARQMKSLEDLLPKADFVSIHVPESPETSLMIGMKELNLMKKGSYLLNASRGSVVSLPALKNALDTGILAGAALDVFETEPEGNGKYNHIFGDCRNVILTPHIGFRITH